jgi:dihydrofolate reductase
MRKVIVCNMMSLDGYTAGPDDNVLVLPMDEAFDAYNAQRLRSAGTLLAGRNTFEGLKSFWPGLADDPDAAAKFRDDPTAVAVLQEISRLNNAIDKVVVSDSLTPDDTDPWRHHTRIINRSDSHGQLAELKQQDGRDILIFGSHTLWNDLLSHGLVDELHLMIGPVVLGDGTAAFEGAPNVTLRTIEVSKLEGSENILVRYEVEH